MLQPQHDHCLGIFRRRLIPVVDSRGTDEPVAEIVPNSQRVSREASRLVPPSANGSESHFSTERDTDRGFVLRLCRR